MTRRQRDVVLVVTPARNAERYIEQTILSTVQQRGDFDIHYHVQDGGSSDATLSIVKKWSECLTAMDGRFHGGAPVHMSWASAEDGSMYDAIQTGFEALLRRFGSIADRRIIMTWINADDVFTAGAFQTAASFLFERSDRHWVTGIPSTITDDGTIADVRDPPYAYSRRLLGLGCYDGRTRPFFQQEGTFWTSSLWSTVGGLNRRLKLAGDWELWRRMARETSVVTLRAVLAHHRRRAGQLSAEMGPYWREVDALMRETGDDAVVNPKDGEMGWAAGRDLASNQWSTYAVQLGSAPAMAGPCLRLDFADAVMPAWVRHVSGLSSVESWGRWSDARLAPSVRICSLPDLPRQAVLRLKVAVVSAQCSPVVLTVGARSFQLEAAIAPSEFLVSVELDAPTDVIDIRPALSMVPQECGWSDDVRRLGVALHTLDITPGAASEPA